MATGEASQYRRGWLEQLPGELARWQQDGLVTPEQAAAIRALYPAPERTGSRLARALTVMAAILIGLGAVLFVAAHWEQMDRWLKVGLLLAALLASYGAGYWLAYARGSYPRVGRALILLGCLIYGADIFLIAQIFHLQANYPSGLLLWALGSLATAWATADELVLVLATVLLGLWTGFEQGDFARLNLWYLLISGGLVLPLVWRLRSRWALGLSALGAGLWWLVGAAQGFGRHGFADGAAVGELMMLGVALLGLALFRLGARAPEWGRQPLRLAGGLLALFGLFVLSFAGLVKQGNLAAAHPGWIAQLGSSLLLLVSLAAAAPQWPPDRWEGLGTALVALLTAALWVLPGSAWVALLTNLALLLAIGGLLATGYRSRSGPLLALALLGFAADVIGRYFDFFWATLDRSLFFLAGGVLLLAVGWLLERQGRRLARGWEVGGRA